MMYFYKLILFKKNYIIHNNINLISYYQNYFIFIINRKYDKHLQKKFKYYSLNQINIF